MAIGYNCRSSLTKRAFNPMVDVNAVSPDAIGLWFGDTFKNGEFTDKTLIIKRTFEMLREAIIENAQFLAPGSSSTNAVIKFGQTKDAVVFNESVGSIAADEAAIIVGIDFPRTTHLFMETAERGYQRFIEQGRANNWAPTNV